MTVTIDGTNNPPIGQGSVTDQLDASNSRFVGFDVDESFAQASRDPININRNEQDVAQS